MGRSFGLVMVVVIGAIGLYLFTRQAQSVTSVGTTPKTVVDVMAVRNDLMAIANAERQYFASNGKYASLDELRMAGVRIPARENYAYSAEITDAAFRIIAAYSGPDGNAPTSLAVDETMAMTTN